ncbi:SAM hydrolase/SAM-dependent halogenase family protein [Desulfonatronum thioautotrophicum]|uniref:SAM hydrolase/SAM-dependent halogenase family protein n=1 Tax=Desulfonatronum thioautotrophicum TaxID=617001 RepID=UPI000B1EFC4B|nr:SAM-dependent chlorinase/fluorinase [Desulfonatronum thioautotrophicum]
MHKPVIALLTDFGLKDAYVGQMKGVLAGMAPEAVILDISHQVRPFDIMQGAFFLAASWRYIPKDGVLLGVVDPGVGTARRLVIIHCSGRFYLGPDNGLPALVIRSGREVQAWELAFPGGAEGSERHGGVAATFHGRDILAPAAARLALGKNPEALGRPLALEDLVRPAWAAPKWEGAAVTACVLHVDRFGNCLLNLPEGLWPDTGLGRIEMRMPLLQSLIPVRTYAEIPANGVGILLGSQGFWELAVNQGSAAAVLSLAPGEPIRLMCAAMDLSMP